MKLEISDETFYILKNFLNIMLFSITSKLTVTAVLQFVQFN